MIVGFYDVDRAEEDEETYQEIQRVLDEQARKVGEAGGPSPRRSPGWERWTKR